MAIDPHIASSTGGVNPADYWDFTPGQRVMTREGFAGVVTAVEDGPYPSTEQYLVTLDHGLGGGAYSSSELAAMVPPLTSTSALSELHEASDDYPELWDVLRNRPPPENTVAEPQSKQADWMVVDDYGATHSGPHDNVIDARNAITDEGLDPDVLNVVREPVFEGETMIDATGTVMDRAIDWFGEKTHYVPGRNPSVDWCRFRRDQHCWYPKHLDIDATHKAGYVVWTPEDRGYCPRNNWDDQRTCPVGDPGPRSGDPNAFPEATLSWEEGGQRGGVSGGPYTTHTSVSIRVEAEAGHQCSVCGNPATWKVGDSYYCVRHLGQGQGQWEQVLQPAAALDDDELGFHFHATWKDVRAKAKKIRTEGHIRVISATQGYVTAEVRGDTNIYQTTIMRVPGGKSTAMWECGCAWANYSWGRSGRWKKYEGRMCAHALALTYEAQAREMFGKEITDDRNLPQWRSDPTIPVVVPGDARTKPQPWRVGAKGNTNYADYDYGDIVVLGWSPLLEPYLDPLMKKLVDYKPDRPLSLGPGVDPTDIMSLTAVLPGISWTPYTRMPFFETLHDLMDAEPTKDHIEELVQDRESLFGQLPTKPVTVDPHTTVFTQPTVNGVKVRQMIERGVTAGGPPAFMVHFRGKDYVIDGHHRLVAQLIKGIHSINAKVLNLDDPAVLRRYLHNQAALVVVALPVMKANPSMEDIAAWLADAARKEEPRCSRDMQQIATEQGGMMAGFAHRVKSSDSILDKLHRREQDYRHSNKPPTQWMQDALRYTIVFHPSVYTAGVQDTLLALEEKGYTVGAEENSWKPGDSFSGLAYNLREPGGLYIELQFATAESFILKQKTLHKLYEEYRDTKTPLRRRQELWDIMTKYWDRVEIPADVLGKPGRPGQVGVGFPEPKTYWRPKAALVRGRGYNPHLVETDPNLSNAPVQALRSTAFLMALVRGVVQRIKAIVGDDEVRLDNGQVVPAADVIHPKYDPSLGILDFHPRLAGARDTPSSQYGMDYQPDLADHPEVVAAKEYTGWSSVPLTTIDPRGLIALEGLMQSSTINRLVADPSKIRSGYDPFIARLSDGREVIIDGHHRVAIANASQSSQLKVHLLDMATHHEAAYHWKSTGEEVSIADLEQIALDNGYTEQDLKSKKADTDKMYPHWLMGVTRPFVYQMWGGPDAPLSLGNGKPSTPWLPRFKHDWDDEAYDNGEDHGLVAAAKVDDPNLYPDGYWNTDEARVVTGRSTWIEGGQEQVTPTLTISPVRSPDTDRKKRGKVYYEITLGPQVVGAGFSQNSDAVEADFHNRFGKVAAARTPWTSEDDQYELLSSAGGRSYTHIGLGETINGQPLALCGTTVAPASIKRENYMMAMGQATCQRCLDSLLRHHQGSHDPMLFEADVDEATLHDEPEPALPDTDGGESEIPKSPKMSAGFPRGSDLQGSLEGAAPTTAPAWLAPSAANGSDRMHAHQAATAEIATMARAFLREGAKVFTPEEQQAIINEDTGERAANLDRLNIEGTHYQRLEALDPDDDEGWLF